MKCNVSTTAYLQNVGRRWQFDKMNAMFKELKFLTPVRCSQPLQNKTAKLPDMFKDHYSCVSSLKQLTDFGGEMDGYICCPNATLCQMYLQTKTSAEK